MHEDWACQPSKRNQGHAQSVGSAFKKTRAQTRCPSSAGWHTPFGAAVTPFVRASDLPSPKPSLQIHGGICARKYTQENACVHLPALAQAHALT